MNTSPRHIMVLLLLVLAGWWLGQVSVSGATRTPSVVYVPQNCYVPQTTVRHSLDMQYLTIPVEVEVPSVIPVPVVQERTTVKEVPVKLTDWESEDELRRFLDETQPVLELTADSQGNFQISNQCEDIALSLRDLAMERGKILSVEVLTAEEYHNWYGLELPPGQAHAVCMARIGNSFYLVEPSNDKFWLAYNDD